jgi:hypothetical protein
MKMKLPISFVVLVFVVSRPLLCAQAQSQENTIVSHKLENLEVTAAKANGQKISFVVRNVGSSPVKVVKDYLPWNTASALKLLAMPVAKGAAAVEAVQPIEDPRATIEEIPAKGELRGELDVSSFFPRWRELTKQGVLVVWSLSLSDVETGASRRFNGVIDYQAK